MAKGFGVAALICALLAIVIPIVGIVVSGIAIVLAIVAAFSGDRAFATATSLIAAVNTFFLSPSVMLVLNTSPAAPVIGVFLFICAAAPIGVILVKSLLDNSSPREIGDPRRPERSMKEATGWQEPKPVPEYTAEPPRARPQQPSGSSANRNESPQRSPEFRFTRADRISSHDRTRDIEERSLAVDSTRKWERLLLIPFLGNYIINNIVAGSVTPIPASTGGGLLTPQYIAYVIFAAIVVALRTWWYLNPLRRMTAMKTGIVFGVSGYIISLLTTLVSGITGVLAQAGSLEELASVLPNFGPFLWNWSTLFNVCFWVVPATLVGCAMQFLQIRPSPSPSIR